MRTIRALPRFDRGLAACLAAALVAGLVGLCLSLALHERLRAPPPDYGPRVKERWIDRWDELNPGRPRPASLQPAPAR